VIDDTGADIRTFVFVPEESYDDFMWCWFSGFLAQMTRRVTNAVTYDRICQMHGRSQGVYNADAPTS
jgi:hypothetical protein